MPAALAFVVSALAPAPRCQPVLIDAWGTAGSAPGSFLRVTGVAVRDDTVYVADGFLDRITLVNDRGDFLGMWGRSGNAPGELRLPLGLTLDAQGDVYVADSNNHRIQRFRPDGTFVESFGDSGSAAGQFLSPSGITLTPDRQLYVADVGNQRVAQVDWSTSPPRPVRHLGAAGQFLGPSGVAVDSLGFLYVVDFNANRVFKLDAQGNEVTSWGGFGDTPGAFFAPVAAVVDGDRLLVSDSANGRMQTFDLAGTFRLAWPAGGLATPTRLALDASRRLFVSSPDRFGVFVFQLEPVAARSETWTGVKRRFR